MSGMLVLSRMRDESIVIDGRIVVTVTDIRSDKVRLGVQAPQDMVVDRMEVHRAKLREQQRNGEAEAEERGEVA